MQPVRRAPAHAVLAASTVRAVALGALLGMLATACGGRLTSAHTRDAKASSEKDCAACAKMCQVAGDAEKNPSAVADCQADCNKKCGDG